MVSFLPLMAGSSAKLIMRSGSAPGTEFPLRFGLNRVGRNPENDVVISEGSISSFHCELGLSEIALAVRDLGSTNGSFINQQKIMKGVVQPGDVLTLGSVDFSVELPEVHIAVPQQQQVEVLGAAFLEDGTPACMNHRTAPATLRCPKCEVWYCDSCVREVKRLTKNASLRFCPECSTACEPMPLYTPAAKKTFFGRLQDTIRLALKK